MIAFISGRIINFVQQKPLIRTTSGLGYIVTVNPNKRLMINENVEFYTLQIFREDKQELFGFENIEELNWIENLLKVNGVGPKSAATIIYTLGVNDIKIALENSDVEAFLKVKGLGKKTAQKIVLELKGDLVDFDNLPQSSSSTDFSHNFMEAMQGLGYKKTEIVLIISNLQKVGGWDLNDLSSTIRAGLALLGK